MKNGKKEIDMGKAYFYIASAFFVVSLVFFGLTVRNITHFDESEALKSARIVRGMVDAKWFKDRLQTVLWLESALRRGDMPTSTIRAMYKQNAIEYNTVVAKYGCGIFQHSGIPTELGMEPTSVFGFDTKIEAEGIIRTGEAGE